MLRLAIWACLFVLTVAKVLTFDPLTVFESSLFGGSSDLLVFVERGRQLGRSPFDKTLRTLDNGVVGFKRDRGLTVANCRGCDVYDELIDRWRLSEDELPVAMLFPDHNEFSDKGKFRVNLAGKSNPLEDLLAFVKAFDAGQLRPWVRGPAPAPGLPAEPEQHGFVREVQGPTFLSEVIDVDANVLLLLYAPFCGFSKQLQPVFTELGRHFAGHPDIRLAKFDTTDNELPTKRWVGELEHHRVPRIYLYLQGKKTRPELYPPEASRTPAALIAWLEERVDSKVLATSPLPSTANAFESDKREF